MVKEILENIYRIEVPLPNNPLKATNSYVITGLQRNWVIDTGLDRKECMRAIRTGLTQLGIDLEKTDFFITHLHADHFALAPRLATKHSVVYMSEIEAERLKEKAPWDDMLIFAELNGFPREELQTALLKHPGYKYGGTKQVPVTTLKDGDRLTMGDYVFTCLLTPGHTKGHMCLYEPRRKILFSGDHILGDITPNIQLWTDTDDSLKAYLLSLDRILNFEVDLVLPGHRHRVLNCHARVHQLKSHHRARAEEVLNILSNGGKCAFEVASQMSWDIDCDSWDDFPVPQKWFATGEAIAHLKFLENKGLIKKNIRNNLAIYSINSKKGLQDDQPY